MRLLSILLIALSVWAVPYIGTTPGYAQQQAPVAPDYAQWEIVATRAEAAVEAAQASDEALGNLRTEVADWRTQFQAQLSANNSRLDTIREQIASLGPEPAEDATEAPEIAQRRSELNEQLTRLSTPRRTAEEAFSRANGIINEIDNILRTRQADQLLKRGPLPINPAFWPAALSDLAEVSGATWAGVVQSWQSSTRREAARQDMPVIALLITLAFVLLLRSRKWSESLAVRLAQKQTATRAGFVGFLVSLGQIVFPIMGVYALVQGIKISGIYGPRGEVLLDVFPAIGVLVFVARWIGSRIFPVAQAVGSPLVLRDERRTEGRLYVMLLAIVFAANLLLNQISEFDRLDEATTSVLEFPLIVLAALMIFRIGQLLRRSELDREKDESEKAYRSRLTSTLGRAARAVGVIAPLLAMLGYTTASEALIYPFGLSLALIATIVLLQVAVGDAYAMFGKSPQGGDGLVPTLIGFVLLVLSFPLFALIWGARVTDLTELWARARAGISIGETTISPGSFLTLILVFMIGYFLTRALQGTLKTSVLPKTKIDPGGQVAMVSGVGYVGIFLAALIAITSAGIDLSSLAIVAGALSVGIGFGLQNIVSNFVSGIILLIERPIAEGDWIEVGGQMGHVRNISVRSTLIETFDRTDVIVPNADLVSGTVTNYTRGNTIGRVIVPVGVAYGTDTKRVEAILREIAQSHPMVVDTPPPNVFFMGFGADSLDFEIRAILRDVNWMIVVRSDMNHQIAEKFTAEGIEIPFAQRDVWLRNPEVLQGNAKPAEQEPATETETQQTSTGAPGT